MRSNIAVSISHHRLGQHDQRREASPSTTNCCSWLCVSASLSSAEDGYHLRESGEHGIDFAGQGHGSLDAIYADLATKCRARDWEVSNLDLLIICGDFQVSSINWP